MSLYTSMSHVPVYVNESCLLCKESCLYVHRISSRYTYDSEYAECSVNFTYTSHVSVYINKSCLYIQRVTSIHIQQRVLGALFTSCTRVMSLYTSMSPYTSCNACVWQAFIRETWLIYMMEMTFSFVWHHSFHSEYAECKLPYTLKQFKDRSRLVHILKSQLAT
jgi:hypothetical protein